MRDNEKQRCQWENCDALPTKHVHFGLRVFDTEDSIHTSDTPYIPHHCDLCAEHAELTVEQYLHSAVFELGECPGFEAHVTSGKIS